MTYEIKQVPGFQTAPHYSTLRVNLVNSDKSSKQIVDDVKAIIGDGFSVEFHPIFKEVIIIYHDSRQTGKCLPIEKREVEESVEKSVVVGADCGNAVLRGADVFSPGVIGIDGNASVGDNVLVFADITGTTSRGSKCKKSSLVASPAQYVYVGRGVLHVEREELFGSNKASDVKGIAVEMKDKMRPSLSELPSHLFFAQNFPSLTCAHVINPNEGDWILDMCGAPGGKAGHVAYLLKTAAKHNALPSFGHVIAIDRTASKVEKITQHFKEWNLQHFASAFCADSSKPDFVNKILRSHDNSKTIQLKAEMFDRILLDAPCSGLGKRPYIQRDVVMDKLGTFNSFQRKFIKNAGKLLKHGGVLVYSTCTTVLDENENQVQWILQNFPQDLQLVHCEPNFGKGGRSDSDLTDTKHLSMVQYFPPEETSSYKFHPCESDTIGFFVSKFMKI